MGSPGAWGRYEQWGQLVREVGMSSGVTWCVEWYEQWGHLVRGVGMSSGVTWCVKLVLVVGLPGVYGWYEQWSNLVCGVV